MKLETWESEDGWRVRILGNNGEIVATTEAYDSLFNAQRALKAIETGIAAESNGNDSNQAA